MGNNRFSLWAVNHLPAFIILAPERVFVGLAAIMVGVGTFIPGTSSDALESVYYKWLVLEWGLSLIVGGVAKVTGLYMSTKVRSGKSRSYEETARFLELVGAGLIGLGAATYGLTVAWAYGADAYVAWTVFILMALANWLRILISNAGRAKLRGVSVDQGE
jgi:hypothetical protein